MSRILVDLDDTVADWGAQYDKLLANLFTNEQTKNIPRSSEVEEWDLFAGRTDAEAGIIRTVLNHANFYNSLLPIRGALNSLHQMEEAGHDVWLVSTPMPSNYFCASDKVAWVREWIPQLADRLILAADKTLIHGDVLFDDRGDVTGAITPDWTQVLIRRPHNLHASNRVRIHDITYWREGLKAVAQLRTMEASA